MGGGGVGLGVGAGVGSGSGAGIGAAPPAMHTTWNFLCPLPDAVLKNIFLFPLLRMQPAGQLPRLWVDLNEPPTALAAPLQVSASVIASPTPSHEFAFFAASA